MNGMFKMIHNNQQVPDEADKTKTQVEMLTRIKNLLKMSVCFRTAVATDIVYYHQ